MPGQTQSGLSSLERVEINIFCPSMSNFSGKHLNVVPCLPPPTSLMEKLSTMTGTLHCIQQELEIQYPNTIGWEFECILCLCINVAPSHGKTWI